ncbi:glycoside hydrolase family 16 protein [uncultured Amphritea sp.]|uniref:glycoside hydrolase family 16 protein n=1 Tax=uncultured Amphritea sp. TaxID=981605 RepID=UPI00262A9943|nr:glycoside hydrolase family 16 protein [uncultured Amphritea sp.]
MISPGFIFCILLFFSSAVSAQSSLVWSDEFNYQGLPDSTKWVYESGYVRNNELQYYKSASLDNSFVKGGVLTIRALSHVDNQNWWGKLFGSNNFFPVTSASLTTKGIASWQYGRVVMRAKLPLGKGVWPAFWTLGDNITSVRWPKSGEIDIMEYVGSSPRQIHGGVHFFDYKKNTKSKLTPVKGENLFTDTPGEFHIYEIEWDDKEIRFIFDGQQWKTFDIDIAGDLNNPFHKAHFLIVNLAIGGSWAGQPEDDLYPADYVIDYIRVYQ